MATESPITNPEPPGPGTVKIHNYKLLTLGQADIATSLKI